MNEITSEIRTQEQENKEKKEIEKGIDDLIVAYNVWSDKLAQYGIQATYAVIAANWATYGNASTIIENHLSLASLIVCIALLVINLFMTWLGTLLHYKRADMAKNDNSFWVEEYQNRNKRSSKWPYTKGIESLADWKRIIITFLPILAGGLFILSIIIPDYRFNW